MTIRPSEIIVTKESDASDLFTFQLDLTTEPTTSEGRHIGDCESKVFMQTRLVGDGAAPQLTTEPTAPEAGGTDGKGYVLTSIQHSATDTSLVDQTDTEASSRLFVGNLTLNSQASVPATAHVAISLGDGKAIEAAGDDYGIGEWSDPAQPDGGTNMSPWTVTHSSDNGDGLAVDPTNPNLETYDWPGEYAQRFDGVDKGGDTFDFQPELTTETTEPTAAEFLRMPFETVMTTSLDGTSNVSRDGSADGFDFSQSTPDGTLAISKSMDMASMKLMGPNGGLGDTDVDARDFLIWHVPAVQTDNGLLLPAVQDDGLLLPAVQTDDAFVFTAIALAESGGNSSPHGEDSLGLFQINVEPNQYDPDAFANDLYDPTGPAVATETLTIVHEGFLG